MALVVVYNEGATPQNVTEIHYSAHTPNWDWRSDVLINPDLTPVVAIAHRYWKVVGTSLSPMTQQEQDDVDAAIDAARDLELRTGAKGEWDGQIPLALALRAFADVLKDEINILRQWLTQFKADVANANNLSDLKVSVALLSNLPARDLAQLKAELKTRIDAGTVDE